MIFFKNYTLMIKKYVTKKNILTNKCCICTSQQNYYWVVDGSWNNVNIATSNTTTLDASNQYTVKDITWNNTSNFLKNVEGLEIEDNLQLRKVLVINTNGCVQIKYIP